MTSRIYLTELYLHVDEGEEQTVTEMLMKRMCRLPNIIEVVSIDVQEDNAICLKFKKSDPVLNEWLITVFTTSGEITMKSASGEVLVRNEDIATIGAEFGSRNRIHAKLEGDTYGIHGLYLDNHLIALYETVSDDGTLYFLPTSPYSGIVLSTVGADTTMPRTGVISYFFTKQEAQ